MVHNKHECMAKMPKINKHVIMFIWNLRVKLLAVRRSGDTYNTVNNHPCCLRSYCVCVGCASAFSLLPNLTLSCIHNVQNGFYRYIQMMKTLNFRSRLKHFGKGFSDCSLWMVFREFIIDIL